MRAQVLKGGVWRELMWLIGDAPMISLHIEPHRLFSFIAPSASFSVYDTDGLYRPGGSLEIVSGDEVRIFAGDSNAIEVFRGSVDRGVSFDPRSGVIRLDAVGWIGQLAGIYAGRREIYGRRDRYIKMAREGDEEYEYIATPDLYEQGWIGAVGFRAGYRQAWLFDSYAQRRDLIFAREGDEDPFGNLFANLVNRYEDDPLGSGAIRRGVRAVAPLGASFGDILAELTRQVNQEVGDHYDASANLGSIVPVVPFDVVIVEETFRDGMFLDFTTDDEEGVIKDVAFGWVDDPAVRPHARDVAMFRIFSGFDTQELLRVPFNLTGYSHPIFQDRTLDLSRYGQQFAPRDVVEFVRNGRDTTYYTAGVWKTLRGGFQLYQLWSWVTIVQRVQGDGDIRYDLLRNWAVEWVEIEQINGEWQPIFRGASQAIDEVFGERQLDRLRAGWLDVIKGVDFTGTGRDTNVNIYIQEFEQPRSIVGFETGIAYRFGNNALLATGQLTPSQIAFRFEDRRIGDILVEIAKLSNSVVVVRQDGDRRVLTIAGREWFDAIHVIPDSVIVNISQSRRNNSGERVGDIASGVISNRYYNDLLRRYYEDTYLPQVQDFWTLECLPTDLTVAPRLLDGIRFSAIGLGDDAAPAIIRGITINEDRVIITAERAA